ITRVPTVLDPVGLGTADIRLLIRACWNASAPKQRKKQSRPDKGICWGLLMSLSAMERVARNKPVLGGAKVTLMSHEPADATLAGHGLLTEKAVVLVPVIVWLVMLRVEAPVFVRVVDKVRNGCLFNFEKSVPKFKLAGMILTVPTVRVMVAVACLVVSAIEVAVRVTVGLAGTGAGGLYR